MSKLTTELVPWFFFFSRVLKWLGSWTEREQSASPMKAQNCEMVTVGGDLRLFHLGRRIDHQLPALEERHLEAGKWPSLVGLWWNCDVQLPADFRFFSLSPSVCQTLFWKDTRPEDVPVSWAQLSSAADCEGRCCVKLLFLLLVLRVFAFCFRWGPPVCPHLSSA